MYIVPCMHLPTNLSNELFASVASGVLRLCLNAYVYHWCFMECFDKVLGGKAGVRNKCP